MIGRRYKLFGLDGLRVHRHVQRAVRKAEHDKCSAQLPGVRGKPRAESGECQPATRQDDHASAAVSICERAAQLHAGNGSDCKKEKK